MSSRSNKLLMGIIILLFGLFILFQRHIHFNIGSAMLALCGAAFVISYKTKRRSWSLVLGGYLIYIGGTNIIKPYISGIYTLNIMNAMFFIVPGVILFILYRDKGRRGLLIPSVILLLLGMSQIFKLFGMGSLFAILPQIVAVIFILTSAVIIIGALKNRN